MWARGTWLSWWKPKSQQKAESSWPPLPRVPQIKSHSQRSRASSMTRNSKVCSTSSLRNITYCTQWQSFDWLTDWPPWSHISFYFLCIKCFNFFPKVKPDMIFTYPHQLLDAEAVSCHSTSLPVNVPADEQVVSMCKTFMHFWGYI